MQILANSLQQFIEAIRSGELVILNPNGRWKKSSSLWHKIVRFFNQEQEYKHRLVNAFIECLDALEKVPVNFSDVQDVDYSLYIKAARILEHKVYSIPLQQRVLALRYRLEGVNGGLDRTHVQYTIWNRLIVHAQSWKREQGIFWNKEITEQDLKRLVEASSYPEFVGLLMADKELENEFYTWILRDHLSAAPFVEFPYHQKIICDHDLTGRIGRLGGDLLKVQKMLIGQCLKKVLTLPFEGRDLSILDHEISVTLRGNYRLTLKEILMVFKRKNVIVGDLELFYQGITNWNAHRCGWWNAVRQKHETVNLDQGEWWWQLPQFESLSLEQAKERYGDYLDGSNWSAAVWATREYLDIDYNKCHAYLEIAMPRYDGTYAVFDFGKFPYQCPDGIIESMFFFAVTSRATVAYPDENVYHTHRQQVSYSFEISPQVGHKLMHAIKMDMLIARQGNLVFQLASENCARWIQEHLVTLLGKENVPNFFRIELIKSEPKGYVGLLFAFTRTLSPKLQLWMVRAMHLPFGAWKGVVVQDSEGNKVLKSLNRTLFWQDGVTYLPSLLHHQLETGQIKKRSDDHLGMREAG